MSPLFFVPCSADFGEVRNIFDMNVAIFRNIFLCIVAVGTGVLIGWLCRGNMAPDRPVIVHKDTTVVVDTNIYINPLPVSYDIVVDASITVPPADITIVNDSLVLPVQTKTYEGDDYRLQISGYRPNLDWIETFPQTKYITTETISVDPRKRWGLGIQVGIGATIHNGRVMAVPYLGVGISYSIIRW